MNIQSFSETIIAPATPAGVSALAVIRVSGEESVQIVDRCFSKSIIKAKGYTMHYGHILDEGRQIDEVVLSVFRTPHSYTGEDSVEISGHGSPYITGRILQTLMKNGARMATPGEFTLRAFLNKKMDLTQAEAVADMIHSHSEAGLQMAMKQMRGGFSKEISVLRQELIDFAALIELENDFGEEDVEFANRPKLRALVEELLKKIEHLRSSFSDGNVLKNGIRTVIAGKPNAGKSTLLNALLKEDRAIVSEIAGTTRDSIEEVLTLNGVQFRLIDTAGLRDSEDEIERIGVGRARSNMASADLLIYLFDASSENHQDLEKEIENLPPTRFKLIVANKIDLQSVNQFQSKAGSNDILSISAKEQSIDALITALEEIAASFEFGNETIVNNVRHADALHQSSVALKTVLNGLDTGVTSDLVALDIRQALYQLGLITGEVTNEDLLDSIFSRFCIGK